MHPCHIRHRFSYVVSRDLKPEIKPRLKQDITPASQPLTHGAVCCLTEIAALGVLIMRPSRNQNDSHIRKF